MTKYHFYTILSYLIWAILPVYWKQLTHISAFEVLAHRITWTSISLLAFILFQSLYLKKKSFAPQLSQCLITGLLLAVNWFIFVYAVNTNRLVEASLGYYINPLISVLLGIIFFKENFNSYRKAAFVLAFTSVLLLTLQMGRLPWISLVLSCSFAVYGLLKKKFQLDSFHSLFVESLILFPFVMGYLIYLKGGAFINSDIKTSGFLFFAGLVTTVPLILFSEGAKKIDLSFVGIFQYIAPTGMLLIGVLFYEETFSLIHLISFALIWLAIFIFSTPMILKKT